MGPKTDLWHFPPALCSPAYVWFVIMTLVQPLPVDFKSIIEIHSWNPVPQLKFHNFSSSACRVWTGLLPSVRSSGLRTPGWTACVSKLPGRSKIRARETDMETKWRCLSRFCSVSPGRSHCEHLPRDSSGPFAAYPAEDPSGQYTWLPLILFPVHTATGVK